MPEIVLTLESRRALKMAVCLREIEYVLELVPEGKLPEAEGSPEAMGRRQEQLLYLARTLENAVKDQSPELPAHQRPQERTSKQVWCRAEGCKKALSLERSKSSHFCAEHQKRDAAK